jgi:uncharacterized protein
MAIPEPRSGSAALVTGASSGIGLEIARRLAGRGHNLVLVARRRERLEALAAQFPDRRVEVFEADLADADSRGKFIVCLAELDLDIELAVLAAGFGMGGSFLDHAADRIAQMIRTNLESTMVLAHALLPAMVARHRGALLIVSSMAGNQPMPGFGAYAATKAAVTSFGEMLSHEAGRSGVTVTVLAPGGVRTEFSETAGMTKQERELPGGLVIDVEECAAAGLEGSEQGRRLVMPRRAVRAFAWFGRHTPRAIWLPLCRRLLSN